MNFLAHFYLSGEYPLIMLGNFLGDFVKGNKVYQYNFQTARGIFLHREIDAYTDAHEIVKESKKRLIPKYNHFSGVIVDVFYDHMLANNWKKFSEVPLYTFADQVYKTLNNYYHEIPGDAQQVLYYMAEHQWLEGYEKVYGIKRALTGINERSKFKAPLGNAITELKKYYHYFENEFLEFFPQLIRHSNNFLR